MSKHVPSWMRYLNRMGRTTERIRNGDYNPPSSPRALKEEERTGFHTQIQEYVAPELEARRVVAEEEKIRSANQKRVNLLYGNLMTIRQTKDAGAKPARILTHGDTRLTLRNWANGRGPVVVYEGDSMTLSDALSLCEAAMEQGFYIVNPEVFEGAYEY